MKSAEVINGKKIAKYHIPSETCHYLRAFYRYNAVEKPLDSSFATLSLARRQNCPNFNNRGIAQKFKRGAGDGK